jgi:hypothetical protein
MGVCIYREAWIMDKNEVKHVVVTVLGNSEGEICRGG